MLRQKKIINKTDFKGEVKQAIDYNGQNMEGVFVSSMGEVYQQIPNTDQYEVCYSYLNTTGNNTVNKWKNGYYKVKINGRLYNLHWIMARAFVPGYQVGLCVDHINNDSRDNRIENFKWITRSQNIKKFWNSLSDDEMAEYKAKYGKGVKKAHEEGKYDEHMKRMFDNKRRGE